MSEINVPADQRKAIAALDVSRLDELLDQCLREERLVGLSDLRLYDCGDYIREQLRIFEKAVQGHSAAKAPKKRAQTEHDVRRAGSSLISAVHQMQSRIEREQREDELFVVDDNVGQPYLHSNRLSVSVSYRWRSQASEPWEFGSIKFTHTHQFAPAYLSAQPRRKPSAAAQATAKEAELFQVWDHLRRLALHSVKEYFQKGGDGSKIPQTFQAKQDTYGGGLNNFSASFWNDRR
ncbi:hypothetical protein [Pseudomonas sp. Pseu.R1]|uniref:hypothetical protein n=1 Tax=Pseudomonas sp. Pseu.R1 TaxID=3379818 RepID=UPI003B946210